MTCPSSGSRPPKAPNPGAGTVHIVSKALVRPLNVRITNIANALEQWCVGSSKLIARHDNYWDGRAEACKAPVYDT